MIFLSPFVPSAAVKTIAFRPGQTDSVEHEIIGILSQVLAALDAAVEGSPPTLSETAQPHELL